jgi:hypothetical protein
MIDDSEAVWIEQHVENARKLMSVDGFQNAIHSLASYRWNPHPRIQLAVLWAGIEGLFGINSEIVFRLSLYVSRFLAPEDDQDRREVFSRVRKLYPHRSAAVHGSAIKEDHLRAIEESALLLLRLVRRCVEVNDVPQVDRLAP